MLENPLQLMVDDPVLDENKKKIPLLDSNGMQVYNKNGKPKYVAKDEKKVIPHLYRNIIRKAPRIKKARKSRVKKTVDVDSTNNVVKDTSVVEKC